MTYTPPAAITLTPEESAMCEKIKLDHENISHDKWQDIRDAVESLTTSLIKRNAIPDSRLDVFQDPRFAEAGSKSPMQHFESNGTSGNDVVRHPHFVKYLHYFVKGPKLPEPVIKGLCQILNDDHGTSGMVLDQMRKYVRESVRKYSLDSSMAGTEFFRLGIEIGLDVEKARSLRDAAKSVR